MHIWMIGHVIDIRSLRSTQYTIALLKNMIITSTAHATRDRPHWFLFGIFTTQSFGWRYPDSISSRMIYEPGYATLSRGKHRCKGFMDRSGTAWKQSISSLSIIACQNHGMKN